jgi:hypothetical protein
MTLVPVSNGTSLTEAVPIDHAAILRALNINVSDPKAQAMILACQKYGLDPLLKHAVLISGNLYVTRDGLLAIAHRSGLLDGIVIEDEGETAEEWWAKVTVHVKDVHYGYTYRGRYPKSGQMKKYGPEMAVKVAEVMALRRAFGVTGVPAVEEQWDTDLLADTGPALATEAQVARIDVLLPLVPADAMPELKAWKADQGISMKAGEFTAVAAALVIGKLEELISSPDGGGTPPASTVGGSQSDADTPEGVPDGASANGPVSSPAASTTVPGGEPEPSEPATAAEEPQTAPTQAAPSGPDTPPSLKATNETAYKSLNRYCRKVASEHFNPDKDTAASQWEALAWSCSGGRTTHLGDLTPDEAGNFRRRCQDLSNGLARWVESDDPAHLGWTFDLTATEGEA